MDKNKPYGDYNPIYYIDLMIAEEKYLEALVVISSYVEIFLEEIIVGAAFKQAKKSGFTLKEIKESASNNTFDMNIKTAVYLGLINKKAYTDLKGFKSERNKMIHDVFSLRKKTNAHLKSVIKNGMRIYIEILEIRRLLIPSVIFGK
jgi:hypothetical protein